MAAEYEVAGELVIIDRASRVLERTLELSRDLVVEFDRINTLGKDLFAGTGIRGFNNQLARMDPLLAGISKSMEAASAKGVDSFDAMTEAAVKLEASIGAIRDQMTETAAAARSMRLPAGAGFGGRGGTGGHGGGGAGTNDFFFGRGGHGGEMGSGAHKYAGYGILGALAFGTYEEATAQTEVSRILLGAGLQVDDLKQRAAVEKVIKQISADTGLNYEESGEAVKNTVLGFPNLPFDQRIGFARSRAQYAMIEHLMKPEISLREAEEASIGLTHMAGMYSESDMLRIQGDVAAISTNTFANLSTIERAASYAMPLARVAGIDPETVFSVVTANQLAGNLNTKSGTWFKDVIVEGLNPKGGLAALMSSKAGERRAVMMRRLGLIDKHGHFTGMEFLEKGDFLGLQKTLSSHLAAIPQEERAGDMAIAAGGSQPGDQLAMFANENYAKNATLAMEKQHTFLTEGPEAALHAQTKFDPSLQLNKTMRDFTGALSNLGTVVLPPLTSALAAVDKTLHTLIPHLPGGEDKSSLTTGDLAKTGAVIGAGLGLMFGGPPGAFVGAVAGAGVGGAAGGAQKSYDWGLSQGVYFDPASGASFPMTPASGSPSNGFGKLGEIFSQSGDKNVHATMSAADKIVAAVMLLPEAIRSGISRAISEEAGRPPGDSGLVTGDIHPLYPPTWR